MSLNVKEVLRHQAVYSLSSKPHIFALFGISEVGLAYEGQAPDHIMPVKETCITKLFYKLGQKHHSRKVRDFSSSVFGQL